MPVIVRPAAVAGRFYPEDPETLRAQIASYLNSAIDNETNVRSPKGIIVPHAGYVYSGPVAASGYAALAKRRDQVRRVVLVGPSHFVRIAGLAVPTAELFETPLGSVAVDVETVGRLLGFPQVEQNDAAHAREHSLEVHLPFLQSILDDFQIVPLTVGEATPQQVAEVMDFLWSGPETAFVISSDLSHFHDYETAMRIDSHTCRLIEELRFEELRGDLCCGFKPIAGLLSAARDRDLSVQTIDKRNSGDTAGPRDRVVGYGAYVVG